MSKREHNSFLTPLVVEVMPSGKRFRLHHEFTYLWKINHTYRRFAVPTGFETDFASIPRIFRIIIPKLGRWNKAAVLHDYLYSFDYVGLGLHSFMAMDRAHADRCFLFAMTDLGVSKWKRTLMYWGVRLGGWMAWRKR